MANLPEVSELTLIEYNSKTEKLEISQGTNKVELFPEDFADILKYEVYKPFIERAQK